jgi:hypothetical protein
MRIGTIESIWKYRVKTSRQVVSKRQDTKETMKPTEENTIRKMAFSCCA